jgi:hypothetical protein
MSTLLPNTSSLLSLLFSINKNINMGLLDIVPAGVVTGDNLRKLFAYGKLYPDVILTNDLHSTNGLCLG